MARGLSLALPSWSTIKSLGRTTFSKNLGAVAPAVSEILRRVFRQKNSSDFADRRDPLGTLPLLSNDLPPGRNSINRTDYQAFLNSIDRETYSQHRVIGIAGDRESAVFDSSKSKVKFSHTRYRALGPELIPVYRQSARR